MYPARLPSDHTSMVLLIDVDDERRSRIISDRLIELVGQFQTCSSTSDCIDYINQLPRTTKVILILVNGVHFNQIISAFDDFKQIKAIYIVDNINDCREKYIRRFNDPSSLLEHVETTNVNINNQPFSFRFLNQEQRSMLDLSKEAASFMWGQLTLTVLQEIPSNPNCFDDMVAACADFYHYDDFELKVIDKFRRTYKPEDAIKWYSRSCFIFRLVNRVLRMEDINGLFVFRQFILDLHMQIAEEHRKRRELISHRRVYRGQRLAISELEGLKTAIGNLVSVNAFFSTSTDPRVAELFIESGKPNKQIRALFIVDVDMNLESTLCADISELSTIRDECEVLFSLLSVFRLEKVDYDKEHDRWEIYFIATDEGRETLNDYKRMMLETRQETNPYLLFGQFLFSRGLYEKANIYYNSLSKLIPTDDLATQASLNILHARSLLLQSKYDESLAVLTRTLTMLEDLGQGFESLQYLQCQFNIANIYVYTNKYESALKLYQQILIAQRKILPSDHYCIAESLSGISWALGSMGDVEQATKYAIRSLAIRQRILPECHPTISHTLRAIGSYHESQGRWLQAQNYFSQAHAWASKYLPRTHVRYAFSLLHLGMMCQNRGEYNNAFDYYSEALEIYQFNFKDGHPSTAYTLNSIANIHRKRKEYDQAFQCLHKALNIQNSILPSCHLSFATTFHCLANVYLDIKDNTKGIEYFTKAIEIKKKHIKLTNPSICQTLSCLATAYSHDGQLELAKETFEHVLNTQQTNHPKGHPDIGITMHHMASNYRRMNDLIKSFELYKRSLGIIQQYFPPNHIEMISIESKIHQLNELMC